MTQMFSGTPFPRQNFLGPCMYKTKVLAQVHIVEYTVELQWLEQAWDREN